MLVPSCEKSSILGSKSHVLVKCKLSVGSVGTCWQVLGECVE